MNTTYVIIRLIEIYLYSKYIMFVTFNYQTNNATLLSNYIKLLYHDRNYWINYI